MGKFRKTRATIKLHTLLDLHVNIPTFPSISHGQLHDVNFLDTFLPEAGAFYVMDRGYVDFKRLNAFQLAGAFLRYPRQAQRCPQTPPLPAGPTSRLGG